MSVFLNKRVYIDRITTNLIKNGYFIKNTRIPFVKYAIRNYEKHVSVIVLCDNEENFITTKHNLDFIEKEIKTELSPQFCLPVKYMYVVLSHNDSLIGIFKKDTAIINGKTSKIRFTMFSKNLYREKAIIKNSVMEQCLYDDVWADRAGYSRLPYEPRVIYVLLLLNILLYVFKIDPLPFCKSFMIAKGEEYRALTYGFFHSSTFHLFGNMLSLYTIGKTVETYIGPAKMMALYISTSIAGAYISLIKTPYINTVGASGAIYGLMGTFIAILLMRKEDFSQIYRLIKYVLLITLLSFLSLNIDAWCHVGGLISGFVLGLVFELCDKLEYNIYLKNHLIKYKEKFLVGKEKN